MGGFPSTDLRSVRRESGQKEKDPGLLFVCVVSMVRTSDIEPSFSGVLVPTSG